MDRIKTLNASIADFLGRLQAAQPTTAELAKNLQMVSEQARTMLPSIASAAKGLRDFDAAQKIYTDQASRDARSDPRSDA